MLLLCCFLLFKYIKLKKFRHRSVYKRTEKHRERRPAQVKISGSLPDCDTELHHVYTTYLNLGSGVKTPPSALLIYSVRLSTHLIPKYSKSVQTNLGRNSHDPILLHNIKDGFDGPHDEPGVSVSSLMRPRFPVWLLGAIVCVVAAGSHFSQPGD